MISGYDGKFIIQTIHGVIKRYRQIETEVKEGSKFWYRQRQTKKEDKLRKGGNSAASWHLKGDIRQTIKIPITPGGELVKQVKKRIQDMVRPDGGKIMTLEINE